MHEGENTRDARGYGLTPEMIANKWKPGQSPNPAGRPLGSRNRQTIVRELLEAPHESGRPNVEVATASIVTKAIAGDVQAWDKLMDSGFGKLADKSEVTGVIATGPTSDLDRQMLAQYISQQSKTDK